MWERRRNRKKGGVKGKERGSHLRLITGLCPEDMQWVDNEDYGFGKYFVNFQVSDVLETNPLIRATMTLI